MINYLTRLNWCSDDQFGSVQK
uniref:Uncharacterized protein n=1 Tax=Anguilla anguilla TaxID=7936 RepID=A0A0E9VYN7_ANGAN